MSIDSGLRNQAGQPITFDRIPCRLFGGYDYAWSCNGCGHQEPKAMEMLASASATRHSQNCGAA